mmetsp:Transcript_20636/g.29435  ORF Transcript_20636/g.29435 Transcript_20636/m.29435 type:complete len:381 (-) Transcript_20636:389-1531(-)
MAHKLRLIGWLWSSLVLHFDGSLSQANRSASCGAAVFLDDHDTLIAIGGKRLKESSYSSTSAEAEYEGVLFGLRWILNAMSTPNRGLLPIGPTELTIRGDCKTVVKQLTGTSNPRKLERKHEEAVSLLDEIKAIRKEKGNGELQIMIEWVPRGLPQQKVVDFIARETNALSERKELQLAECAIFENSLRDALKIVINPRSPITQSKRHEILERLASVAEEAGDFQVVLEVGKFLREEASRLSKHRRSSPSATLQFKQYRDQLVAKGITMEMRGFALAGLETEASKYKAKYRYRLQSLKPHRTVVYGRDLPTNSLINSAIDERETVSSQMEAFRWSRELKLWKIKASDSRQAEAGFTTQNGLHDDSLAVWLEFPPVAHKPP